MNLDLVPKAFLSKTRRLNFKKKEMNSLTWLISEKAVDLFCWKGSEKNMYEGPMDKAKGGWD